MAQGGSCEWPIPVTSWRDAVLWMETQVAAKRPDIVLIGCGGLGMILGARLKAAGIPCVVLGGAIQVLFGIKGKRWEKHSVISEFWNDAWVSPAADEVPTAAHIVEGGCYW